MDCAPSPLSSWGLERWDFPFCLCPTWNKGEVGRIPSIQTSQWGAAWQAALQLGLQADLLILGKKAEFDTLKREGLKSSLSQVPKYPYLGGYVLGVSVGSLEFQI